jgi:hypothetical protein
MRNETKACILDRRKLPVSARHRRTALSMMVCNMGCRSCGEPAMARSTSEIAGLMRSKFGYLLL